MSQPGATAKAFDPNDRSTRSASNDHAPPRRGKKSCSMHAKLGCFASHSGRSSSVFSFAVAGGTGGIGSGGLLVPGEGGAGAPTSAGAVEGPSSVSCEPQAKQKRTRA